MNTSNHQYTGKEGSEMSPHEFYLLACQYVPGSPQFRKIIERAAKIYPDKNVHCFAMAMFNYLSNNIPAALESLRGLEDDPEAWLYFSAFHIRDGDLDKAGYYAGKAFDAGNPDAQDHLEIIEQYKKDENAHQHNSFT